MEDLNKLGPEVPLHMSHFGAVWLGPQLFEPTSRVGFEIPLTSPMLRV